MPPPSNISKRRSSALKEGSEEYLAKRAELLAIAASQFKQRGFKASTLAEIGHKAGLDRATVYYYFGSKEELFRECLRTSVDANLRTCVAIFEDHSLTARERLHAVVVQLMRAYDANYPNMYVYIQEDMDTIANEKSIWAQEIKENTKLFERIVISLIAQAIDDGDLRGDIPPLLAANAIFGMLNWTHRWYQPGGKHPAEQVSEAFFTIFSQGMGVRK
jgi:AcrR family transcriptional regulator